MKKAVAKYWKEPNWLLVIAVLGLMTFGLVAVSSASSVLSYQRFGNNNHYFFRQILFAAAGLIAMSVASRADYHLWKKLAKPIFLVVILTLAAVLVPGIGFESGNARSWFSVGPFLLQPSEFAKLALIFYLSGWFERVRGSEENFWFGIMPPLLAVGLMMGLVIIEPDTGTTAILGFITVAILFAAGARIKYLAGLFAAAAAGLWIVIKASPYRAARLITFLDPSIDPRGIGYHINQALLAIGSGGFLGYGFGLSRQKHNYLPETIGDSIFAVMAEELGFARVALVVLAFAVFGFLGFRIAKHSPDRFGQLTAVGITSWIVLQALVNIAAISGLAPLTGITLPFISYGGSSLLAVSVGVGILLNISRQRT